MRTSPWSEVRCHPCGNRTVNPEWSSLSSAPPWRYGEGGKGVPDSRNVVSHPDVRIEASRPRSARKQVFIPVHSVGIGQRLLDVAELLDCDPRISLVFAAAPVSTSNGVEGLLREAGVAVLDWRHALARRHDLVITTNHDRLCQLNAPTVVIPDPRGRLRPALRLPCERREPSPVDIHDAGGKPCPARDPSLRLAAHKEDRQAVPDCRHSLADRVEVVGDLTFDRLHLSIRSRDTYRAALGVHARHQLVVVVSTWGPDSLITREPRLLRQLTVELPEVRYRIAVLLHPAAWFSHDITHLKAWMTTARTASVQIIDPFTQWRPIIAAADLVISARGSITLYSTGIGLPVLYADPTPSATISLNHDSQPDETPQLCLDTDLQTQLDIAARWHTKEMQCLAVRHVTSIPGQAGHFTRSAIYRMLELVPPSTTPLITPIRGPRRMT